MNAESQSMVDLIRADLTAKAQWLYGGTSRRDLLHALCTDGTFAMIVYRLMQACDRHGLAPLTMFFNKLNGVLGQCIIGRHASFGPGLVFIHSQGIVINSAVEGGSNIKLEHQVTIGANRGASPRLGNDVFVGAGARIIGGITLGDRAVVGANAVVTHDVPEGATVVGIPARVIRQDGMPVKDAAE